MPSESFNKQYRDDTVSALATSLHSEYATGSGRSLSSDRLVTRLKQLIVSYLPTDRRRRALHIGCGTGRLTFELAQFFRQVSAPVELLRDAIELCIFRADICLVT